MAGLGFTGAAGRAEALEEIDSVPHIFPRSPRCVLGPPRMARRCSTTGPALFHL